MTEIAWLNIYEDAFQVAQKENKPILTDWADRPSCIGCVSLESTTYPNAEVVDYINEHFTPLQLNQRQNLSLFRDNGIIWTPTITASNASGKELDRFIGYLPPEEFLARIKFARTRLLMFSQEWSEAADQLSEIASMHSGSLYAPGALYWLGVARWKVSRDFSDLRTPWVKLMETYPKSEASVRASCLETLSPGSLG